MCYLVAKDRYARPCRSSVKHSSNRNRMPIAFKYYVVGKDIGLKFSLNRDLRHVITPHNTNYETTITCE